ncbi:MAG: hypothetical protein NT045_07905 [Candidatus Aureabacteria bacterium]|nr:hypothetical protein [Candidatus Auribacterota bacterium]
MTRREAFEKYLCGLSAWDRCVLRATQRGSNAARGYFARAWIRGTGLEIGAQCNPLVIARGRATIRYLDRLQPMDDPLRALIEWLRVLREGGILFLTVPNCRSNEYDFMRTPVTLAHCIEVYRSPARRMAYRMDHWREFVALTDGIPESDPRFAAWVGRYAQRDDRIHFHVYDIAVVMALLRFAREELGAGMALMDYFCFRSCYEFICVIQKRSSAGRGVLKGVFRGIRNLLLLLSLVRQKK